MLTTMATSYALLIVCLPYIEFENFFYMYYEVVKNLCSIFKYATGCAHSDAEGRFPDHAVRNSHQFISPGPIFRIPRLNH